MYLIVCVFAAHTSACCPYKCKLTVRTVIDEKKCAIVFGLKDKYNLIRKNKEKEE